ncbi:MAG: hypothetical protein MZV64_28970 [Ignavibacteriales bacterium]|nr:hypothetical protein [Ignavibacteriales bacterium]
MISRPEYERLRGAGVDAGRAGEAVGPIGRRPSGSPRTVGQGDFAVHTPQSLQGGLCAGRPGKGRSSRRGWSGARWGRRGQQKGR